MWVCYFHCCLFPTASALYKGENTLCLSAPILAYISGKIQAISKGL